MNIFSEIFYRPLLNVLAYLVNLTHGNIGIAIILLTIMVRILLYPFTQGTLVSQKRLQELQPKINELKAKHGKNKDAFAKELMTLYKSERVNPFSSCLMVLIQLPFLFALYSVFQQGLNDAGFPPGQLYSFVRVPATTSPIFFGVNLTHPNIFFALLAGASQFLQARYLPRTPPPAPVDGSKDESMLAAMNTQTMYVLPVVTAVIGMSIPSGLTLYWAVSTLLFLLQQWNTLRHRAVALPQG